MRHILIDFGTTKRPANGPTLVQIAEDIKTECSGKLHAVVATHRHADHISGFAGRSGEIIASLKPDVVLQPWTEDPKAAADAKQSTSARSTGGKGFVATLASMHDVANLALAEIKKPAVGKKTVREQVKFLGEDNLKNLDAVRTLSERMKGRKVYAYYGRSPGLSAALPGVKVHVLGPPTLKQSETITRQREKDLSEFWHFQALASRVSAGKTLAVFDGWPQVSRKRPPVESRWFLSRLDEARGEQLLEIVRILDEAMNNTSLILLFEVGRTKLLFPGDAQIENWLYALTAAPDQEQVRRLLADVHVYKVGYHGSLNATPKTLWQLFKHKSADAGPERLMTFMSTLGGKHGSRPRGTEVPRTKLVEELEKNSTHFTTQSLRKKSEFARDFEIVVAT